MQDFAYYFSIVYLQKFCRVFGKREIIVNA